MGLIKWIKRELDSSNSCKRRQSEPPLPGKSCQLPRDESYVKALSKFNEWRQRQIFGSTARLSRKRNRKLIEKIEKRGQSDTFLENRNNSNDKHILSKNVTTIDNIENSLYEEIEANDFKQQPNDLNSTPVRNTLDIVPTRHSFPTTDLARARTRKDSTSNQQNDLQIYENAIVELVNQFDRSPDIINISKHILTPPVKFFNRESSNPFANVRTPIREPVVDDQSDEEWIYESPRDLEKLRAAFKPFGELDCVRESTSSNSRSSRCPPYQTVINKHGDEVEYALPLNEKPEDEEDCNTEAVNKSYCRVLTLNNTSSFQQYVDENFDFLNENERLDELRMSASFSRNQLNRNNVLVTDLDKTSGTKLTDDQNNSNKIDIIRELESLEVWCRNITENIENTTSVEERRINMHFAEIIVCSTNEVAENEPRQIFTALNGTLHSGTFHCVPVTQFKPHRGEQLYGDSTLQSNYEILRKIRHPDIALLMGIIVDNRCSLDSLVLEPLDYSLNHFIHDERRCIPLPMCLIYTQQINNAVTYLHKHGLVHSNISTHSIIMCHLSKSVKLTSFELTTTQNGDLIEELKSILQNDNLHLSDATQLPYKLRPYNVHYRKTFSQYNYQAPELLSNQYPFVFPKIQCDVYGVCLTLWEMVNCSVPLADCDYEEVMELAYLPTTPLSTVREERQRPFEQVLRLGMNYALEKRISDTTELKEALNQIFIGADDKIDAPNSEKNLLSIKDSSDRISHLLGPKPFVPSIFYERTSTIKKRKNTAAENRISARQLFVCSQMEKAKEPSGSMVPSDTSSPNSPQYGFEIGEVSIPETPIARSNKLRKTAWLSNQSISPIVHLEIKSQVNNDSATNGLQIVENNILNEDATEDVSTNKSYNVNIRIRPNTRKTKGSDKQYDIISQSITENNSPAQPQKNTSQISDHIKFFNLVSKPMVQKTVCPQTKTTSPVENNLNYNKNDVKPAPAKEKILNEDPKTPVNQKEITDFFSRSHSSADFENSLWRREKQKCDQSVKNQRRISVKDAVNKFESFSKSMIGECNTPKSRRTYSITSSQSDGQRKALSERRPCHDTNLERNVSKLNVVLRNKSDSSCKDSLELKKSEDGSEYREQSPMLTLNFKKLDRRASDVGSYFIQQNPKTKALTARHSIYGTEIFQRLRKAKFSGDNGEDEVKEGNKLATGKNRFRGNKDFKIKVGKLTCLNCGHKLFVVDDIVPSKIGEDVNEAYTELLLTPLKRNLGLQVNKSTEDFYIDDDFCEDIDLCANMELGTRSCLSDLIDFDILSAEIFNPTEEMANQFL